MIRSIADSEELTRITVFRQEKRTCFLVFLFYESHNSWVMFKVSQDSNFKLKITFAYACIRNGISDSCQLRQAKGNKRYILFKN